MTTFNAGDRVILTDSLVSYLEAGALGVVRALPKSGTNNTSFFEILFDGEPGYMLLDDGEFELVEAKPTAAGLTLAEVGDRIDAAANLAHELGHIEAEISLTTMMVALLLGTDADRQVIRKLVEG